MENIVKLDEIINEWKKDCEVDITNLGSESIKIPKLHSKYLSMYYSERRELKAYELKKDDLYYMKHRYYNGRMTQEELDQNGWEPFLEDLKTKSAIDSYIQADKDYKTVNVRIINQNEKISLLEEIIKHINQRNFQIKNAIDYYKFTNAQY